jgi:hypothetical protein
VRSSKVLKRVAFGLVTAILVCALAEFFALLAFAFVKGTFYSSTEIRSLQRDHLAEEEGGFVDGDVKSPVRTLTQREYRIHPYVGYVIDRAPERSLPLDIEGIHVTEYGYLDIQPPIHKRSEEKVIVGVLGGSVANLFTHGGHRVLAERLRESTRFAEREFVFVRLALGGYKQPQQLQTIAYLLSLGAEFDIVINIDGFNEVALYPAEYGRKGFPVSYPRGWRQRVETLPDPLVLRLMGEISHLVGEREALAREALAGPFTFSVMRNLWWFVADRRLDRRIFAAREKLMQRETESETRSAPGPRVEFDDDDVLYSALAELWVRSSIQLDRLLRANDTLYVHFLQPNQYVRNSKPMSDEERAVAIREDAPYRRGARAGYPRLIEAGRGLAESGVHFRDLTRIFETVSEPVYVDSCCHMNPLGNEIVAEQIADTILRGLSERE